MVFLLWGASLLCAVRFTPYTALMAMAICHRVRFIGVCYGVIDVRITPWFFAVGCFVAVP